MEIGEKVRVLREDLGLSQEDLAEKMGYKSKTSIHKIEQGITDLPLSKVNELAKALKTTPAYLMGWEDEENIVDLDDEEPIIEDIDTSFLTEKQQAQLDQLLTLNTTMFFNGGKNLTEKDKKYLKYLITKTFIETLDNVEW